MQVSSGFFRWFSSLPNDLRGNSDNQSRESTFVGQSVEGSHRRRGLGRSSSSGAPPPPPAPPLPPPCPCSPARICHSSSQELVQNCDTQIHLLAHSEAKMKVFLSLPHHLLLPPAAVLPPPPPPPQVVLVHIDQGEEGGAGQHEGSGEVVAGPWTRPWPRQKCQKTKMIIEVWQKCLL